MTTRIHFRLGGRSRLVLVRSPTLGGAAPRFYPDYRISLRPLPVKEARSVGAEALPSAQERPSDLELEEEAGGGPFRIRSTRGSWAGPDPGRALARFELTLGEILVEAAVEEGAHPLHAGGLGGSGGGALLLVGRGGAGKSTLSAALAMRGHPVFGDDVILLDRSSGHVLPFRRLIKLVPPAPEILGLPEAHGPAGALWPSSSLFHPEELGSGWAEPAPVRHVVFPRLVAGDEQGLIPLPAGRAMARLLSQILYREPPGGELFDALARSFRKASFHDLPFSHALDAADEIEALLD